MDYLKQLLSTRPDSKHIDLSNRKLEDLKPLISILSKFTNLSELNLSNNKLTSLPPTFTALQSTRSLNITNNPFTNFQDLVSILENFAHLEHLQISLSQKEEVALVLSTLTNLKTLNGQQVEEDEEDLEEDSEENVKRPSPPAAKVEEEPTKAELTELKPQDLEETVKIYDAIRAMKKRTDPTKDKQLTQDLDRKMAEIVAMLKGTLKNDTPLVLRNEAILKAKAALLGMSFVKMIDGVPDRLSENIWKSIKGSYDSVIGGYADIIEHLKPELVKENPARNDTEFRELIDAAKELEEELRSVSEQKEEMKKSFEQEKHELLSRIAALEEENKKLVKKPEVPSRSFPDQPLKDVRRYSPGVAPPPSKSMTLKQLKDLIFDMYHQKAKYDEKCAENRQPKETMEQYMYVYLNQIYGLKSLIIEGAGGIIQGIKKYSSVDSDVALFGKILRNECDEDFKLVFNEVKVAMTNILKERLKKKYKLKTETELNKMVKDIQQGEIEENYWAAIIRKMYNEEHYGILTGRIKEKIELDRNNVRLEGKKMTREELSAMKAKQGNKIFYSDFQKIVLDFQLSTHEAYLRKFTNLFKEIDTETSGVIDESGFRLLLGRMGISVNEAEIERLLQIVDPYNNQRITYSECLSLLSSVLLLEATQIEVVDEDGNTGLKTVSILEKFISESI